jgi:DNA-nicking Smr family endonuclease
VTKQRRVGPQSGKDDGGAAAFAEAMRDARKLPGPGRVPVVPAATPAAAAGQARRHPPAPAPPAGASSRRFSIDVDGEGWAARADGVDRRVLRQLRQGTIAVQGKIDLHGLSRAQALRALDSFLAAARADGRRCLLIVHGRGLHSEDRGATLRDAVREQVTTGAQAAGVLAGSSAPPALGGPGATLVWLRR